MNRLAPALCLLALVLGVPTAAWSRTVELKLAQNGHFLAEAEINGRSVDVLVDTGATVVALSYEDARKTGFRTASFDFKYPVSTANGVVKAAKVTIRRIVIDSIRIENVDAMIMPEGALTGSLLGMSFLSRLDSYKVENGVLYLRD